MSKKLLFLTALLFLAINVNAQTSQTPVITGVSVNSNSYQLGTPITMTWSRSGNFPAGNSYFVYIKDKPDQVLGNHSSMRGIHYSAVASWQPALAYPTLMFGSPLVPPGTYYLEVDFVDPSGTVITTATSKSFEITPLVLNIVSTKAGSSIELSNLSPSQKQSIAVKLQAIINKLVQLVAELTGQGVH